MSLKQKKKQTQTKKIKPNKKIEPKRKNQAKLGWTGFFSKNRTETNRFEPVSVRFCFFFLIIISVWLCFLIKNWTKNNYLYIFVLELMKKNHFVFGWIRNICWLIKLKVNYLIIIWFVSKSQELAFEL